MTMKPSITDLVKQKDSLREEDLMPGLSAADQAKVQEAIAWARIVYADRVLPMGELILTHALGIAKQATAQGMDAPSRLAAILSRVPSIVPDSDSRIAKQYGESTLALIHGLEKLRRLDFTLQAHSLSAEDQRDRKAEIQQAEALRKMLLVLAHDMRMVVLKLISRIQTLRYLYKHPTDSAREVALATLHFFAPLANRLNLQDIKWPLEDWAFRILEPDRYQALAKVVQLRRAERERLIQDFLAEVTARLIPLGIQAKIYGRAKHLYSIHKKTQRKNLRAEELFDLHATRMLVDSVEQCYQVLSVVHENWQHINKEFDDYIARPKSNGYQSIHTVSMFRGLPIEVQIRTHEMHRLAESGVASHWRYKEGVANDAQFEERLQLLRELMDWHKQVAADDRQLHSLAEDTIYCLTPKGEVYDLPSGATPVDFAYRVHSELGHRCRGAKVDGVLVPLTTPLQSGQRVEVLTAKEGGPSRDWLLDNNAFVKSGRARGKIRQWFNVHEHEQRIAEGKSQWLRVQNRLRPTGKAAPSGEEVANALGFADTSEFFLAMSRGDVGMHQLQALVRGNEEWINVEPSKATRPKKNTLFHSASTATHSEFTGKVTVLDMGELSTQMAACCAPHPPDPIIGYINRQNTVSVHRANCRDLWQSSNRLPERVIAVAWQRTPSPTQSKAPDIHSSTLHHWKITGKSRPSLLPEVMAVLQADQSPPITLTSMTFDRTEDNAILTPTITLSFRTNALQHESLKHQLQQCPSVQFIEVLA